jgi:hypothetical protein
MFTKTLGRINPLNTTPYYFSTYNQVLLVVSFLLAFPSEPYMHSSSPSWRSIPLPIEPCSTWSTSKLHVVMFLIVQHSPSSHHFISLRSKYSPRPMSSSYYQRPSLTYKKATTNYSSYVYFSFYVFREQTRRQNIVKCWPQALLEFSWIKFGFITVPTLNTIVTPVCVTEEQ